ncbi:sulfatase-like hydrolase/transferase [Halanaerobium hydrogeniformans]|uniref:Sulfatase n=1 Tax=Halanaerobium hydrogeniformans TaxID=656519 RepID=E4RNB3_HALHG|nr:sulfatase-like hydrolase/transferase [Halanaerobium hydrogeniformans]ADQ13581.1 sulfatase [Halanaerobium hydrogeniformans]
MAEKKPKKIILILTETQRTDYLNCYGNSSMKTPNIDKLANEGMKFEKAYTTQPVCGPARSAIFTGQYPHSNGVYSNSMAPNELVKNIGQRLQKNNFKSAYIGKWHLDGGDYFGFGECPDGWDENYWYDMRCYLEELSIEDRKRSRKPETVYDEDFTEEFTYAHRVTDRAIDCLENYEEDDLFMVVSYDEPHSPSLCPPEYIEMYENMDLSFMKNKNYEEENPEHQKLWSENSKQKEDKVIVDGVSLEQRLGCNTFVDYEIGRVINAIEKYAPDAMIIYTADHGECIREHELRSKGAAMYDEITNIPLIIKYPEFISKNKIYSKPVSHINIAPTIMEAADLKIPEVIEGEGLLNVLKGDDTRKNEEIFMEFHRYEIDHDGFGSFQPIRSVFDGRYKLVINLLTSDELYDLENNPEETENLIDNNSIKVIRNNLHDKLLKWMNNTRDPYRGYYWERRPWRDDARAASWDYTGMTRQRKPDTGEKKPLDYDTGLEVTEYNRNKN